jgi:site-specific DNA-methyltransferase (adenine-specific)
MNDEWGTPDWPFRYLNKFYEFELDIAAKAENTKCKRWLVNAFKDSWLPAKAVWCNPPYSSGQVERWLNICYHKRAEYWRIAVLLPVDTSTNWFQRFRKRTQLVLFFNRRISFIGADNTARFASCLFVFGDDQVDKQEEIKHLNVLGDVWLTR